jgi:hypothetical protein
MYSSIPSMFQFEMVSTFDVNGKRISVACRLPIAAANWIGFSPCDAKNIQKLLHLAMKSTNINVTETIYNYLFICNHTTHQLKQQLICKSK